MTFEVTALVLAAGIGKRMRSDKSKVLFEVAGRPLLAYPLRAARAAGVRRAVVVVSGGNQAAIARYLSEHEADFAGLECKTALQREQRGTGDAVRAALPGVRSEWTLILYGDGPLILDGDLSRLLDVARRDEARLALLTCELDEPTGYGRILRDDGAIAGVREERDLEGDAEARIREVNPGIYVVRSDLLREAIGSLKPNNAQGEYYLTDIVAFAAARGPVVGVEGDGSALLGVNDRAQLRDVEARLFERIRERHARAGVTIRGDAQIDDAVNVEADAELGHNVVLRGTTTLRAGAVVDVGCVVTDSTLGKNARLEPYSVVTVSDVGDDVRIGPFAHLRPGSVIESEARIGNFVETKNTHVQKGAKANHLAYLGDADIGQRTNIGAGTIVCNYDGFTKSRTRIGADAFIGSDSQLVAPVSIGAGAYVGTGSTITQDVPDEALAIARSRQVNKDGYAPGLRARLKAKAEK